ncbi:MAG: hypothetical protein FD123_2973 [Bacteroidetes bacterium]|nr:MAG: hypothetical protein FD123_2973 [Bacteroidota bacterium]
MRIFFTLLLIFAGNILSAQPATWKIDYSIPGSYYNANAHCPLFDGGFAHFSSFSPPPYTTTETQLLKTDAAGQADWTTSWSIPVAGYVFGTKVLQLPDSGFVFAETVYQPTAATYTREITRVNAAGTPLWSKGFESGINTINITVAYATDITASADGGFVISGDAIDTTTFMHYYHLLKVDAAGNLLWSELYNYSMGKSYHRSLDKCLNEDILITGEWLDTIQSTGYYPVLTRVDQNGNFLWSKRFFNPAETIQTSQGIVTTDGGFLITGTRYDPQTLLGEPFLVKTDSMGLISWIKTYRVPGQHAVGAKVRQNSDGGYLLSGDTDTLAFLMRLDATGQHLWTKCYPGIHFADLQLLNDGYSLAGSNIMTQDLVHIKTDTNGVTLCGESMLAIVPGSFTLVSFTASPYGPLPLINQNTGAPVKNTDPPVNIICSTVGQQEIEIRETINIYPVPAGDYLVIESAETINNIGLYNLAGQLLLKDNSGDKKIILPLSNLPPGMYVIRLQTGSGSFCRKVAVN